MPKSHNSFIHKAWFQKLPQRLAYFIIKLIKLSATKTLVPLDTSAGDLLIFDGRLLHSSAHQRDKRSKDIRKIAFYFSVTGDLENAKAFAKSEMYKLGDEIASDILDESQRIQYIGSSKSMHMHEQCSQNGVNFFPIESRFLMSLKKSAL